MSRSVVPGPSDAEGVKTTSLSRQGRRKVQS